MKANPGYSTIDNYIELFPAPVQKKLNTLRQLIGKLAPDAQEKIAYQMPTFFLNGNLVHFAAHANHIGFYPTPSAILEFKRELSKYETSKGAVQFPMDQELPLALISRIVKFRVQENLQKRPRR